MECKCKIVEVCLERLDKIQKQEIISECCKCVGHECKQYKGYPEYLFDRHKKDMSFPRQDDGLSTQEGMFKVALIEQGLKGKKLQAVLDECKQTGKWIYGE